MEAIKIRKIIKIDHKRMKAYSPGLINAIKNAINITS
jgi:hypothetical protein